MIPETVQQALFHRAEALGFPRLRLDDARHVLEGRPAWERFIACPTMDEVRAADVALLALEVSHDMTEGGGGAVISEDLERGLRRLVRDVELYRVTHGFYPANSEMAAVLDAHDTVRSWIGVGPRVVADASPAEPIVGRKTFEIHIVLSEAPTAPLWIKIEPREVGER